MSVATGHAITLEELSPEWLTEVLRRTNALPAGSVVAIEKQPTSAFNSHTLHLKPIYSATAPPSAPARLLLKCSLPAAWAQAAGAREVAFYQRVQKLPDHPNVIVHCYDAVHDAESGNSHLLLDDLSASHTVAVTRDNQINFVDNLPSDRTLGQVVDALARFHAYWWQHPQLSQIAPVAWGCGSEASFQTEVAKRKRAWEHLLTQVGEWLPPHVKALYATFLAQLMPLWRTYMRERVAPFSNLTITHGDAYLANFLCPREGQIGETYLIDWQSPEPYRGPTDLVNMCATFWRRHERAEGERELNVLRRYHCTLQEQGISGYSWDDLVMDYRLSIIDWLWVPVQDCLDGSGKEYWWPKMQCLIAAYEDWDVSKLLTH